tara:strand:- start:263 stop:1186 length:924 start_codon:yes stop_codon:yes gene_type:complete
MNENIAIEVKNLSKVYKGQNKYALDNVSFKIKSGIIFGLLGPNGAGKSTFINILADLVHKSSGSINVLGHNHEKELITVKSKMGIVPQELNIDPFFTPFELLEIQAGLYGVHKKNRNTMKILNMLSLQDKSHSYARTLSGGMRRRLLIGKAMVHNPDILILDEPTAGVDVGLRKTLWKNIEELKNQGKTIIITTHYLHEAEELCDEIAIINNGKLVAIDKTSNIKSLIDNKKIIIKHNSENKINLTELKKLNIEISIKPYKITIDYKPKEIDSNYLLTCLTKANIKIEDILIQDSNLEEVFLKLVKN